MREPSPFLFRGNGISGASGIVIESPTGRLSDRVPGHRSAPLVFCPASGMGWKQKSPPELLHALRGLLPALLRARKFGTHSACKNAASRIPYASPLSRLEAGPGK